MATLVHDRMIIAVPGASARPGLVNQVLATLTLWSRRIQEREALAQFGWRERKDLALSLSDIEREIAKPFWRA